MNLNENPKHSSGDISYFTVYDSGAVRPYGVAAQTKGEPSDRAVANRLFFTEAEAEACCKWLAENEVQPVTLCEVLENIYVL